MVVSYNSSLFVFLVGLGTMPPLDALDTIPLAGSMSAPPATTGNPVSSRPGFLVSSAAAAAAFCNLLPFGGTSSAQTGTVVYIGEGLPPVHSCQSTRTSVGPVAPWTLWNAKDEAVSKVCCLLAKFISKQLQGRMHVKDSL